MNSINNILNRIKNFLLKYIKVIIPIVIGLIILFIGIQIYLFYKNKKILQQSLIYYNSENIDSEINFVNSMNQISKNNNFYGLISSLDLIKIKLKNGEYEESFTDYIYLLKRNNVDNLYRTLLSIHASYNLLNKIDDQKIYDLLSFVDKSLISFEGFHLEISYLLSLKNNDLNESNKIFDQIIKNQNISASIKQRIKKINDFENYK